MATTTPVEHYLSQHDDDDWLTALREIRAEIHEVDRIATRIWLAFYPLVLERAAAEASDRASFELAWKLEGSYRLRDHIDTSHRFLYGHRYWSEAKRAVVDLCDRTTGRIVGPIAALVRDAARAAAAASGRDASWLTGITYVALRTVHLAGLEALRASQDAVSLPPSELAKTPEQVLRERAKDDSQGLFGFLRGERKQWTVTFDEHDRSARFPLTHTQAITTAAAADRRDWRQRDPRCTEGPIPVQCRSASCGTCWVGVLGGAEKLSAVEARERQRLGEFGYISTSDPHPVIRLACQAQAYGAVSIVIPPWNGVFGKLRDRDRATAVAST